jgi:predicted component of type VI protein secretion system
VCFPITELEVFIGRLPECQICSKDASVSRRHARLVFHEGKWWAEDLGSRNGVMINGQVIQSAILPEGAILRVGDQYFAFTEGDFPDDASVEAWKQPFVEMAEALHAALPVPPKPGEEVPTSAAPPKTQPQTPMPPASFKPAARVLANSPVTRAYPPRAPQSSAKVSAILRLPGSTTGAMPAVRPGTPVVPVASGGAKPAAGGAQIQSLQVTGPDYAWYAVIALAVLVLIGALVVFFVQRARYAEASQQTSWVVPAITELVG